MPVNLTERGLPYGYQPEDFGQVGVSRNAAGTGSIADDCFLISYFTSPITINYRNTYVVMFKDLHDDTQSTLTKDVSYYVWTVEDLDKETDPIVKGPVEQKHGVFEYTPPNRFLLCITVEIYNDNDVLLRSLTIEQKVDKLNNEIEMLIKSPHSTSSFSAAGNHHVSRDLLNNYMPHIREIYKSDNDEYKIPRRLLSASIFNNLYYRSETRADFLEKAADELNRDDDTCRFTDYPMGLNRISPQLASMILCDRSVVYKSSYTKWLELPESIWPPCKMKGIIRVNFRNLGKKRVEIFNFIRFPKSNISLLYKLLNKLKQRTHRYPELKTNDFLYDDMAPKVVYQEYRDGYGSQIPNSDVIIRPYELINTMNHPVMGLIDPLSDYEARNVVCIADKDTGRIIETRDTKKGLFKKCEVPVGEHYGIDVDQELSSQCKQDYNIIILDVGYWGHFENTQRDFGMIENNHVWLCRLNSWTTDPGSINKKTIDLLTTALGGNDRKNIASEFVRKLQSEWGQAVELVSHTEIDKLPPDLVLPNDQLTIAFPDLHLPEKLPDFPQKEDFHTNLRARKILRNELRLCQHSPPLTSSPTIPIPMDQEKQIEIQKYLYDLFYGTTRSKYSVMDNGKKHWFTPKEFLAEKALVDRRIAIESMWFYEREAAWGNDTFYHKNKNDPDEFERRFYCKPTAAIDIISVLLTIKDLKQQQYNIKSIQVGDLCEMWMNNEWLYGMFCEKILDPNLIKKFETRVAERSIAWFGTKDFDEYQYRLDPIWLSIKPTAPLMENLSDLEKITRDIPQEIDVETFAGILSQLEQTHQNFILYNYPYATHKGFVSSAYIAPTSVQDKYRLKFTRNWADKCDLALIFLSVKHAAKPYIFHKWPYDDFTKQHRIGNELIEAEVTMWRREILRAKVLVKNRIDDINNLSLPFAGNSNQKKCFKKFLSMSVLRQRTSTDFATNARGQKEYFWNECILKLFNEVECKMIYGNHDGYRGDSILNPLDPSSKPHEKVVPWICEDGIWAEHGHRWDFFNRDGMAFGAAVTNLVYYYNEGILSLDKLKESWPLEIRQFHEEFLPGYVQWSMIINGCITDVVDKLKRDKKIGNFAVQIVGHTHSPDLLKIKIKKGRSN